jgi:hypothetical protein
MKKIKSALFLLSFVLILVFNMNMLFSKEQGIDINLGQLLSLSSVQAEDLSPNDHYGFIRPMGSSCCTQRYHDDLCTANCFN